MKILFFDAFAGIAGDMTVGALIDLGVPFAHLEECIGLLPLPRSAYSLATERVSRHGITATRFVCREEEHQPHRDYEGIAGMIEGSRLGNSIKERAQKILFRIAEAEAKVHGVDLARVHFHEIGALDSIIDIVGAAACLDWLRADEIHCSPLTVGSGFVQTAHGLLPIPAPATAELLRGLPVRAGGEGERTTPTGAAIVAALATGFGPLPDMTVTGIGCGAGTKDFHDMPNVLRVFLGEQADTQETTDRVVVVETNLDDVSGEVLGFLMERLLAEGALDVSFTPCQMKKNRPGIRLTLLAEPAALDRLSRIVLLESTAIGLRYHDVQRRKLERTVEERQTSLGPVRVKVLRERNTVIRTAPEYDDCRTIALASGLPLLEVYRRVERETQS